MNYMILPGVKRISKSKLTAILINKQLTAEFNHVCEYYNCNPKKVKSYNKTRKREYVLIRQVCMLIFKCKYDISLAISGAYFIKDHATALHAIKTVIQLRSTDSNFKKETEPLLKGVDFAHYQKKYA